MFVLKVTKGEEEPEFNQIPVYYQEMIIASQNLKQKYRRLHSVIEPGEQYILCYNLININEKVLTESTCTWAKQGILKVIFSLFCGHLSTGKFYNNKYLFYTAIYQNKSQIAKLLQHKYVQILK